MIKKTLSLTARFRTLKFLTACLVASPFASAGAADIPQDLMVDLDSLTVSKSEFVCLALNDYFEARGESPAGRLAVPRWCSTGPWTPAFRQTSAA